MERDLCACCGRLGFDLARCGGARIHLDCWSEHHSGPEHVWPPDHRCDLTAAEDEADDDT